jgi:tetratricopeptide (TPR) repeat protein
MNFVALVRCVLVAIAILVAIPVDSPAQLARNANKAPVATQNYVIPVRELAIPSNARDSLQNGNRLLAKSDFSGAASQFQRAIAGFPNYYEAYFLLGIADLKMDREGDAEKAFRKALEFSDGRYALPYFGLGLVLCGEKDFAQAAIEAQMGLDLDSEGWFGYYAQGRALFGLGRLDEAEKSARDLIARKADLAEAYLLLADIHQQQNRTVELLTDLDEYIALDDDKATRKRAQDIRDNLQRSIFRAGASLIPEP